MSSGPLAITNSGRSQQRSRRRSTYKLDEGRQQLKIPCDALDKEHALFIEDNEFFLPPVDVTYLYVTYRLVLDLCGYTNICLLLMGGWVVHGLMFYVIDDYGRLGGAWNNLKLETFMYGSYMN